MRVSIKQYLSLPKNLDNQTFSRLFGNYEEVINKAEILLKNKINQRTDPTSKPLQLPTIPKRQLSTIPNNFNILCSLSKLKCHSCMG